MKLKQKQQSCSALTPKIHDVMRILDRFFVLFFFSTSYHMLSITLSLKLCGKNIGREQISETSKHPR